MFLISVITFTVGSNEDGYLLVTGQKDSSVQ